MIFPEEIQAARLRLVKTHPYLASAAWALQPVVRPGLGTLAVDMWWRLYYDPAITQKWTVEELSGVLYHEIMHLLRDHASRLQNFDLRLANICADAEINDNLIAEGIILPADPITPASIGQPENLLAEEYYAALESQAQEEESNFRQEKTSAEGASSASHSSNEENQISSATNESPGDTPDDSKVGDSGGSKSGNEEEDETYGESAGSNQISSLSDQPPDTSTQSGVSSQALDQKPMPGSGRCGSCATGQQEPWEEGSPNENTSPGTSLAEAELIRRDVARQIQEHSQTCGNIPGHWKRWAEEKLHPKVNWRKELAAAIRHAVADVAGASDYSYRRPSRRQGQIGNGKVVLPSLRRPVPSVAVVVDTSGSVNDTMLAQTLGEISGILKGLGQRESVHVLAVDEIVHVCHRIFRPEQVKLAGGGGTDMGKGIAAAAKLRPKPQVCVVITDGYTPWPDRAPRGIKVIVALTGDGNSPKWAKTVKVEG